MYKVLREFAPTTLTFNTKASLEEFKDVLYLAHKQANGGPHWGGRDVKRMQYIERLIKELT